VLVLADDFSWNLVPYLPNISAMQRDGMTFARNFVTDSLCCPSRASILTGMYPHNTRVFANVGERGGYGAFVREGNDTKTFAVALQRGGYRTALLGKYLNEYEPGEHGPALGWSEWAVAGKGYESYDYDLNESGAVVRYGSAPEDYITDVLAGIALFSVAREPTVPFLLMFSSFAPHSPYIPAPRHREVFPGLEYPKTAAFVADPKASDPAWLRRLPPLHREIMHDVDEIFANRVRSMLAVDEMLGELRAQLEATGRDRETYVFFTSDNGFHIGERRMIPGKQTAFDSDIRVPLLVTGPGVPAGRITELVTQTIDLYPTFAELAGVEPPPTVNGRSLVALLRGEEVRGWRDVALIEHEQPDYTAIDPDAEHEPTLLTAANTTPSYRALRAADFVYVEYVTGEIEFHDHASDPDELYNTAATLSLERHAKYRAAIEAIASCETAEECWAAQHL
jgi:N-acetylglucosamine-6-sulfatase